ncbi:hypothetical protein KC367_g4688 [Hortaea werneckii]|nr:hypothetical protein KC329_g2827 [Hortaea werneckii]KAI7276267.1 hypothetical protein KC335_g815 [Hortaea werneckii]KAI7419435.1 hypothetical protein KC332_g1465 [Hortaea werneckii]KAI7453985.1 hypothetical protein KC368_g1979 [Hortaea werneckii]KAI7473634.1 hypothetical protein KC357_g5437 [Hortaea werneckii]
MSALEQDMYPIRWAPPFDASSQAVVMDLAEIFFEVVYPVFPLFHQPTLLRRVARGEYLTDRSLFASVAAMCALASARARDGAVYTPTWDLASLSQPTSESFLAAAVEALPRDAPLTQDFNYMRACVLISITYIQYGRMAESQYYLNTYHSFVAVGSLHDEHEWPPHEGRVEIEERRRLFWSAYTLDVFTSIIGTSVIRGSEAAFNVCYPSDIDEGTPGSAIGVLGMNTETGTVPWFKGWNFVTDLYRILEHTLYGLRQLRPNGRRTPAMPVTFFDCPVSQNAVLDHVMAMYEDLPPIFKSTPPITNDPRNTLFGFQAANIAATVQLVRMVLFTTEGSDVEQKCQIAGDLIRAFRSIPVEYLQAISSPLLHHLTGIGVILGSAFHFGLTRSSYRRIRSVLLELTELISHLETGLHYSTGTSDKLRTQVKCIDEFWHTHGSSDRSAVGSAEGSGSEAIISSNDSSTGRPQQQTNSEQVAENSPPFYFPPELLDNWSWVFDAAY